jgi:hypothetical protein
VSTCRDHCSALSLPRGRFYIATIWAQGMKRSKVHVVTTCLSSSFLRSGIASISTSMPTWPRRVPWRDAPRQARPRSGLGDAAHGHEALRSRGHPATARWAPNARVIAMITNPNYPPHAADRPRSQRIVGAGSAPLTSSRRRGGTGARP